MKKLLLLGAFLTTTVFAFESGDYKCKYHYEAYTGKIIIDYIYSLRKDGTAKIAMDFSTGEKKVERGYWQDLGDAAKVVKEDWVLIEENGRYYMGDAKHAECKKVK